MMMTYTENDYSDICVCYACKYNNEMKGDVAMEDQQRIWKQGTVYI